MANNDAIKAALAEAQRHAVGNDGEPIPAAPIVTAFLRALPPGKTFSRFDHNEGRVRRIDTDDLHVLAGQIEKAARDA